MFTPESQYPGVTIRQWRVSKDDQDVNTGPSVQEYIGAGAGVCDISPPAV